jgi:hypothetical protein
MEPDSCKITEYSGFPRLSNREAKLLILGVLSSSDRLSGFPHYQMLDERDFSEFLHSYRSKVAYFHPKKHI